MQRKPMQRHLIIGTRASPLALTQTEQVHQALLTAHGWPVDIVSLAKITTRGDTIVDKPLAEIGGKGLFTEEIDAGLRDHSLDCAVHSLKDLPTAENSDLVTVVVLPRACSADVLIAAPRLVVEAATLDGLPYGARLGTASLRRRAQLLNMRPDLKIEMLRGNIDTRLRKLKEDRLDGIILAAAGLERMQLTPQGRVILPASLMLPAAGQGALAVQCRADDADMIEWLAPLHCPDTHACVSAERAFLAALDGSCRTPIAALAMLLPDKLMIPGQIYLRGRVLDDDGAKSVTREATGSVDAAADLGRTLADEIRALAPDLVSG